MFFFFFLKMHRGFNRKCIWDFQHHICLGNLWFSSSLIFRSRCSCFICHIIYLPVLLLLLYLHRHKRAVEKKSNEFWCYASLRIRNCIILKSIDLFVLVSIAKTNVKQAIRSFSHEAPVWKRFKGNFHSLCFEI